VTSRSEHGLEKKGNRMGARVRGGGAGAARAPFDLESRRRPCQGRARATVEAILEAAADVIAREGYAAMTTNRVAARAGVSIGSLYQYFPNKQAILVALLEQHLKGLQPVIEQSLQELADPGIPFAEAMHRMFTGLLELHRAEDSRLQRVLGEEVPHPPHIRERHRQREGEYTGRVAAILRDRPDVQVGKPEVAAQVLVQATSALSRWMAHEAPEGLDRKAYIDEAVRLLTTYVRPPLSS
jgi:AcrR family transcriptional regulator